MVAQKTVAFHTLGCKLNFSETAHIQREFENAAFSIVPFQQGADIVIINTCSVTEKADKEFSLIVRKALGINQEAFIIAIGCYAQLKPHQLAEIYGVDLVLGAHEKLNVLQYINNLQKNEVCDVYSCDIQDVNTFESSYSLNQRTRAFLKVQDGCDYKCTYCTIPSARGKSRSDSIENVIQNVETIAQNDFKEIVLTGVNIGDFGFSHPSDNNSRKVSFFDLIQSLDKIDKMERFRISSIEPNLLYQDIIDFIKKSSKFVNHFHLPLQSGSDKVLKLMKRRYNSTFYKQKVQYIKSMILDCCIGVDVIVGFPGESDIDFLETYHFLNELDISYLHVFTYSERDDTEAVHLNEKVSNDIKRKRSKMLRTLSLKKQLAFYKSQVNSQQKVLFESENKNGFIYGFTGNYIKVKTNWHHSLVNNIFDITLTSLNSEGLMDFDFSKPLGRKASLKSLLLS